MSQSSNKREESAKVAAEGLECGAHSWNPAEERKVRVKKPRRHRTGLHKDEKQEMTRLRGIRCEDVFSRIRFDEAFSAADWVVGYTDRFLGLCEVPFSAFLTCKADWVEGIPLHRVQHMKSGILGLELTRGNKFRSPAAAAAAATHCSSSLKCSGSPEGGQTHWTRSARTAKIFCGASTTNSVELAAAAAAAQPPAASTTAKVTASCARAALSSDAACNPRHLQPAACKCVGGAASALTAALEEDGDISDADSAEEELKLQKVLKEIQVEIVTAQRSAGKAAAFDLGEFMPLSKAMTCAVTCESSKATAALLRAGSASSAAAESEAGLSKMACTAISEPASSWAALLRGAGPAQFSASAFAAAD